MKAANVNAADRHRSHVKFSLISLFLFMTGVCILLFFRSHLRNVDVTLPFELRSHLSGVFGTKNRRNIDVLGLTQFPDCQAEDFLRTVVNDPEVANLLLIRSQDDPVRWLQDSLQVQLAPDSNRLTLGLTVPRSQRRQAEKILIAVFREFLQEAQPNDHLREQLAAQTAKDAAEEPRLGRMAR